MPKRTNEEDFDLEDDIFDEELEEDDDLDGEDEDDDDDLFLSPDMKKAFEKAKREAEAAVIKAITDGDTNSPVYKGMQRVLSKRDQENQEIRNALANTIQHVQYLYGQIGDANGYVAFLQDVLPEMMDEPTRETFKGRLNSHIEKTKAQQLEQKVQYLERQGQQPQNTGVDPRIEEIKRLADEKLRNLAKGFGIDPDDENLDYGDDADNLFDRMDKLTASLQKARQARSDKANKVRRNGKLPSTRTDTPTGGIDSDLGYGQSLLSKASANMIKGMRRGA